MNELYIVQPTKDYLEHHGILGMKWGVRRYQNKDGSYTSAGRARYGYAHNTSRKMEYGQHDSSVTKKVKDDYNNLSDKEFMSKYKVDRKTYAKRVDKYGDPYMNSPMAKIEKKLSAKNIYKKDKKKALKIGAAVVGTAAVAAGAAFVANKLSYKAGLGVRKELESIGKDWLDTKYDHMRKASEFRNMADKYKMNAGHNSDSYNLLKALDYGDKASDDYDDWMRAIIYGYQKK